LQERGVEHDFVSVAPPTRECVTLIDQAAGTITELVEESRPVTESDYAKLLARVQAHVIGCAAVVMSGTITPGGPSDFYLQCTRLAHQANAVAVLDASGPALLAALPARPALVKPNRAELAATLGCKLETETALIEAMQDLHRRGAQRIVITAGAEPALAFDGQGLWRLTAPPIAVVNPIGSGDAFTAGFTWRLALQHSFVDACRWASATGAANALTPMAGEINRADVDRLLPEVRVEAI
jgi:1-phosphofructokinase family hexose kinase